MRVGADWPPVCSKPPWLPCAWCAGHHRLAGAIGPEQFEVGAEVREAFLAQQSTAQQAFRAYPGRPGKYLADIYTLARQRLAGVDVHEVSGGGLCTVSDPRFYSYRRDKTTGRMGSLIWLK
jgi:copper oxidase (laccase) domain-containing protein